MNVLLFSMPAMEQYGKILLFAMPAFLVLVVFEKLYGVIKKRDTVKSIDMFSSLTSGVTNVTKDVLQLSIVILSYPFLVEHLAITHLKSTLLIYIVTFIALDFAGYCVHRMEHRINVLWNLHLVHHSSEEFNLACALRQSISEIVKIFAIFLLPAALLGVPHSVVAVVGPIHLFAQFWYHTQHINKMGFLEHIIVTPSHHRVHHAINPIYIDKNYSQIFIFWDKIFGTFQAELNEEPCVFGITRPVSTWNPIKINFQHLWLLIKDAWRAKNFKDKLRIWFMPTGWRPEDVESKFPVHKINDVYNFKKYETEASNAFVIWGWVQLIFILLFVSYLFGNIAGIGFPAVFYYGGFIFLSIYAFTDLLDNNKYAWVWELVKNLIGVAIIVKTGDWFGASKISSGIPYFVASYFVISTIVTYLFNHQFEGKQKHVLS